MTTEPMTTEPMTTEPGAGTRTIRRATPATTATGNLLLDFPKLLADGITSLVDDPAPATADPAAFSPGFALPTTDSAMQEFYAAATVGWSPLGDYRGHGLTLLDLAGNPGTHTTKTFPSLLIVARAVEYIRRTGEGVIIFSPTSANKGTALRDAVARALAAGLARPDQLRVVILAPQACQDKLRGGPLSDDPGLRALNPLLLYTGEQSEKVKQVGRAFVDEHAAALKADHGLNTWFSLDLRNYLIADTARAYFEQQVDPTSDGARRVHAHAVSSAFGLLGYHAGREVLESSGTIDPGSRPQSLLVQHMATADMVLSLHTGDFERAGMPAYAADPETGLFHRGDDDPHFPATTFDPDEVLDPTFYTRRPATSPQMNSIIETYGGDGIVVSLHECLQRYPAIRALLADHPRPLPADPRRIREWSLVMALTGVLESIDRGLISDGVDVVVHGTGWYSDGDYPRLEHAAITPVDGVDAVAAAVAGSVRDGR